MSRWHQGEAEAAVAAPDVVADQLAAALMARGFEVDREVGQSHFRCNLAVRKAGDLSYRLGILTDNQAYYEQADLLERDMMRPKLLRVFGWRVAQVLAKDWYDDRSTVLERIERVLRGEPEESAADDNTHGEMAPVATPASSTDSLNLPLPIGADVPPEDDGISDLKLSM